MIIHAYLTSGFYPWAKIFVESFKFHNGEDVKMVLSTRGLTEKQINTLKSIYKNLDIQNDEFPIADMAKKAGIDKKKLLEHKKEVEEKHVTPQNKIWKLMIAADDRVKSVYGVMKQNIDEDYMLHFDIDIYFRTPIDDLVKFARQHDICIRLRLNSEPNRKTMIGVQCYRIGDKALDFLQRWISYIDAVKPQDRPLGYGQTSCWYAYEEVKNSCKWGSVPLKFISPFMKEKDAIWSANTDKGKTENLKICRKDFNKIKKNNKPVKFSTFGGGDMSKILVLGCDGYIGHAMTLKLLKEGYSVIGVDDLRRREAVREMKSFSATKIKTMAEKEKQFSKLGDFSFHCFELESNYELLKDIMSSSDISAIVNLAQQPSAPYSHKSIEHTHRTTTGNLLGTVNVLYAMRDAAPNAHLIQIGSMGEYDPAVNVDIPEGLFEFEYKGRGASVSIFPRRPGSWYHASKVASTYYIDCACRWWGIRATDIMQGVVYGGWTPEIAENGLYSRLDSDEAFGTVVHRFLIQAIIGESMTVYGKGLHKRGFLALNDSVQCLMLALENPPSEGEYNTWNQLDTVHSMNDIVGNVRKIANEFDINPKKIFMDSPRKEAVGDHYYNPIVDKLKDLGFKPTRNMRDELRFLFELLLKDKDRLNKLKKVVIPKILWK